MAIKQTRQRVPCHVETPSTLRHGPSDFFIFQDVPDHLSGVWWVVHGHGCFPPSVFLRCQGSRSSQVDAAISCPACRSENFLASDSRSGPRPPPRHCRSERQFSSFPRHVHSKGHACRPSTDVARSRVDPCLSAKTLQPDPPVHAGCAADGLGSIAECRHVRTNASTPHALSSPTHYRVLRRALQVSECRKITHQGTLSGWGRSRCRVQAGSGPSRNGNGLGSVVGLASAQPGSVFSYTCSSSTSRTHCASAPHRCSGCNPKRWCR